MPDSQTPVGKSVCRSDGVRSNDEYPFLVFSWKTNLSGPILVSNSKSNRPIRTSLIREQSSISCVIVIFGIKARAFLLSFAQLCASLTFWVKARIRVEHQDRL